MKKLILSCVVLLSSLGAAAQYSHTIQAEKLDRGVVAVKTDGGVFVSWRSLVSDDKGMAFDVYRDGVKINSTPLINKTNITDAAGTVNSKYTVKAVVNSDVVETTPEVQPWQNLFKRIPMQRPEGGVFVGNNKFSDSKGTVTDEYEYTPNSVSVGDVDGDGKWEYIVKWAPTNHSDNSFQWYTGKCYFDCYKEDGTRLWRIDMGINIRSGNHYTQFLVYDFDGDGKAEFMVKTAPGTKDGTGKPVIMGNDDPNADYRTSGKGTILKGPEYLTVFNGETGAEINTIAYNPPRNVRSDWGDSYGNRCERYLACVAYLDGKKPSAVFCRGYYTHAYLWAVDFDGKNLTEKWLHSSTTKNSGAYGEGAHSLTVGDVDADGCDEIIYGACAIDNDGSLLYRTGGGHGDALHLGDFCPEREGLEVWMVFEEMKKWDAAMRDARTGEIIYSEPASKDNGRGVTANISSKYPGYEAWSQTTVMWAGGQKHSDLKIPDKNFRVYWDGDLLDELYEGKGNSPDDPGLKCNLTKVNEDISKITTLIDFAKYGACHSFLTKRVPLLQADLFGDWREEMIFFDKTNSSDLLIFTTTIPSDYRVNSLMQDRQYRLAVAWQNVAYHQPPHLGYNLEESFNTMGAISITAGNLNQITYAGDEIQPISFKVLRATGVEVKGLPEGVSYTFDPATLTGTISGSVDAAGEYSFSISTTGAKDDQNVTVTGAFNVRINTSLEMLAYYPFETVGATTPNLIRGEAKVADGKAEGSVSEGKKGNALMLTGSAYIQEGYDLIDLNSQSFTIELWMNSTAAEKNCYIINKGVISPSNGSGHWTGIEYKDNKGVKELRFAIDDNVTKSEIKTTEADKYFDGQWHHVVAARDAIAKQLLLYIDGVLVASGNDGSGAIVTPATEPLTIGNTCISLDNPYDGMLDELTIYRGVMSASKVKERYEATGAEYVAYFPMDDIGETTPNSTHGEATSSNGSAISTSGLLGGAMAFDGSYYLTQPIYDAINFGEKDFSVELWMRSTDDDGYLFCFGTHNTTNVEGGTGNWIGLEKKADNFNFSIDDNIKKSECKSIKNANEIFDGKWHHIVCVRNFNDKTIKLYVDGVEVGVLTGITTGAINFSATELLFIGGDDESGNRTFNGDMDEFKVYDRALTPEEIEEHYNMLRLSEIEDILAESANARYTVVDAFSGRIIRTAVGEDRTDIIDSLQQGIYILVVEDGKSMKTYKFVKKQ